jgi:hypothetical protein
VLQATHKGVEIELESHQLPHGLWNCDYTLITHPGRTRTIHRGDTEFPTKDLADEHALQEARVAIDRDAKGQREEKMVNAPKQVRI